MRLEAGARRTADGGRQAEKIVSGAPRSDPAWPLRAAKVPESGRRGRIGLPRARRAQLSYCRAKTRFSDDCKTTKSSVF